MFSYKKNGVVSLLVWWEIYSALCKDELLKFMGERHLEKQQLPFVSSRKLKSLEVHTNFVLLYFVIDVLGMTWISLVCQGKQETSF